MDADSKLQIAFDNIGKAEETSKAVWVDPEPEDEFQANIKSTAKNLLKAIDKSAGGAYALEPTELARLTKAVCELQGAFFGKDDKATGNIIMTNQLSMFKGML